MRSPGRLSATLTLLTSLLLVPAVVAADEFSDFRIPDHRVFGAITNLRGSLSKDHGQGVFSGSAMHKDVAFGQFEGSSFWWHDSENRYSSLTGSIRLDGSRFSERSRSDLYTAVPFAAHQTTGLDNLNRDMRESMFLSGYWRRYPWTRPVALAMSGVASSSLSQTWDRRTSDTRYEDPVSTSVVRTTNNEEGHFRNLDLSLSAAAGYGKVRDATGVYEARMLERRLQRLGVLKQPLTPAGAGKLATLFYIESSFGSVHDRPDKFFWREVEKILREDGALGDQALDAYSLLRVIEPLFQPGRGLFPAAALFIRRSGCFAGLAVTDQQSHQVQRRTSHVTSFQQTDTNPPLIDDLSSSLRTTNDDNLVLVGPQAEVHRPIGMRWQVDANASAGFAILNNRKVDEALQVNSSAAATYEIADRWLWTAQTSWFRTYLTRPTDWMDISSSQWTAQWGTALQYFLEDHVVLDLAFVEEQDKYRAWSPISSDFHNYHRQDRVELGVSYRFLGGLDAPGVIAPVRLMPRGN